MDYYSKALSKLTWFLVDKAGYNSAMIQHRRWCYEMIGKTQSFGTVKIVVAGSKGEGISRMPESDIDQLIFCLDIICGEWGSHEYSYKTPWIFKMNTCDASPGYTLLFPTRLGYSENILNCFSHYRSTVCLSSSMWLDYVGNMHQIASDFFPMIDMKPREGPSMPIKVYNNVTRDFVHSILCHCPTILYEWLIRPRRYEWPSWELRVDILRLPANVCAVGCKKDTSSKHEWRFCFNLGELRLVQSLNEAQTKLYIILKMCMKDLLKPTNKDITSYTMKNIVFWLCEMNPQSEFTSDSLMYWVRKGLCMLKQSVEINFLPYYMIPGRNLLKSMPADRKHTLLARIDCLISNPQLVLQCKMLNFAIKLFEMKLLNEWQYEQESLERMHLEWEMIHGHLTQCEEPPDRVEALVQRSHYLVDRTSAPRSLQSRIMRLLAKECEIDVL